jgi:NAD(P)H-dependent FMN reductase/ketosteroid isomerase-like protein
MNQARPSEARTVAVVVGSLRTGSFSRQVAKALIDLAPDTLSCRIIEIGDLGLYNQDLDPKPPAAWSRFRDEIRACDAVLFVTPEYNRSVPGVLKNALDIGSRPEGKSVFDGMPAGVVSVTPYKMGAFGANHALRQTFVFLNMPVMQQPEAYLGDAADLLDDAGKPKSEKTASFLRAFMAAFTDWVDTVTGADQRTAFQAFMQRRATIAEAYVNGEAAPLDQILTHSDPATFFSPSGYAEQGADAVAERYDTDARSFAPSGKSRLEVLQATASGDLAFWTGFQHATAHFAGKPEPASMKLRVTEVFRFEDGGWKLAHRHAEQPSAPG